MQRCFQSSNSAEGLHFSAFHYSRLAYGLHVERFCIRIYSIYSICVVLYLLRFSASTNLYCYRHCGFPARARACVRACVCVCVRSFLPPRASRSRNNYGYVRVHCDTENSLYSASFRSYGRRHLLASKPLTAPELQNTDTNGIHATRA